MDESSDGVIGFDDGEWVLFKFRDRVVGAYDGKILQLPEANEPLWRAEDLTLFAKWLLDVAEHMKGVGEGPKKVRL